jgi:hypothetical protein
MRFAYCLHRSMNADNVFAAPVAGDDVHFPATGATVRAVPAKMTGKAISLPGDTYWKVLYTLFNASIFRAVSVRALAVQNLQILWLVAHLSCLIGQGASGRKPLQVGDDVVGLDPDQLAVLAPGPRC